MPFRLRNWNCLALTAWVAVWALSGCNPKQDVGEDRKQALARIWWKPWQRLRSPTASLPGADVVVHWKGNRVFSERQLRAAIEEQLYQIRNEGLTPPNADDAAYYTAIFYHQNGFAHAEAHYRIEGKRLELEVNEGSRVQLGSIGMEGNQSIPSTPLLELLTSVSTERLQLPRSRLPLIVADLEAGAGRIAEKYRNEGFMDVVVSPPNITFSSDASSADVLLSIEEGTRYRFGPIQLKGQLVYPEEQIRAVLDPIAKLPFTPARLNALQAALQKFYSNRSHFSPQIRIEGDPTATANRGIVTVTLSIQPGPTSAFRGLEIHGLERLKESWIRSRLRSLDGAPYDPEKLASKQQELLSSGIFEDLRISPVLQADNSLKLDIEAHEARTRELSFSAGFGNYEGVLGEIRASDRNLFGRALQGSVAVAASQRALGLEATVINPWLFETRTQLLTRIFLRNRIERGYEKREGGIRGELSRRLFPQMTAALYGQVRSVEVTTTELPVDLIGATAYQIATFGISGTYDRRDSLLNPTSGWIVGISTDTHSLQTGQAWLRTMGRLTLHYPLPYRIRFAASSRFGIISQNASIPIDERFFLGGSTTVRSFQERALGKSVNERAPLGGSSFSLLNFETDFPVWNKLRGALFFDAGSLSSRGVNIPTSNFRTAIGLGARYALPVGPVRLDVGFNPDRIEGEPRAAAHLSFGFAF